MKRERRKKRKRQIDGVCESVREREGDKQRERESKREPANSSHEFACQNALLVFKHRTYRNWKNRKFKIVSFQKRLNHEINT